MTASESAEGGDAEYAVAGTSPGDSFIMNSVKHGVEAFKAKRDAPIFDMEKEKVLCELLA